MPSYSKSTPDLLKKRLRELYEELALTSPQVMQEIRLIEGLLKATGEDSSQPYASITSPWDAIDTCLTLRGDWKMTKVQIMEEILNGGYLASKPKASRGLLNDSLNYHIKKGYLTMKGELIGRNPKKNS
jgi:hypothetical protein